MNPDMKLVIAGAVLIVALAFFFFGQSLVDAPENVADATPTPAAFLRTLVLPSG
jgi:hypothetical protein